MVISSRRHRLRDESASGEPALIISFVGHQRVRVDPGLGLGSGSGLRVWCGQGLGFWCVCVWEIGFGRFGRVWEGLGGLHSLKSPGS
eukprot:166976-Amorphochlora_amoeboformis.AAC.1